MICWKHWPRSPWCKHIKAGKQASHAVTAAYYQTPLPASSVPINAAGFAALDLETTGLDPATDHVLSIGLVHIDQLSIRLESAWHEHVFTPRSIPEQSAIIHRITDDTAAGGKSIDELMPQLLQRLSGRILIAHHAQLETGFLNKICRKLYSQELVVPVIDTEVLARRRMQQRDQAMEAGALRLFNLRQLYNLPQYTAHNALSDAIAAAELFLAQAGNLCPSMNCKLKQFITG